jgi:hypothetical protein
MPHIIFLNRFFHPDHSSTSQIVSDLAFHVASSDKIVHVFIAVRGRLANFLDAPFFYPWPRVTNFSDTFWGSGGVYALGQSGLCCRARCAV